MANQNREVKGSPLIERIKYQPVGFHLLRPPSLGLFLRRVLSPAVDRGPVAAAAPDYGAGGVLLAVGHVHERDLQRAGHCFVV